MKLAQATAVCVVAMILGMIAGQGVARAAKIDVAFTSTLRGTGVCTVTARLTPAPVAHTTVLLQQRIRSSWRTRVASSARHGAVRMEFRVRATERRLLLRLVIVRNRHVLTISRAKWVTTQHSVSRLPGLSVGGSTAALVGATRPVIVSGPSDQTAMVGASASFAVTISGTPAPAVQWQVSRDGGATFQDIAGSTSGVLTLTGLLASDDGSRYRAVGTNSVGVVASSSAGLTVLGNALGAGRALTVDQYLTSSNDEFELAMQNDGNLVLYNRYGRALWASKTEGNPGAYLVNQASDGNLVIYSVSGEPLWASSTEGNPGDSLRLENSGNLVIASSGGQVVWQTSALDHSLLGGEGLLGSASQILVSPNQQFQLAMQADGNLVMYNNYGRALWASNTAGNPGAYLVNQSSDGNLVIYAADGHVVWDAGTQGNPGDALQLQDDGNLVMYSSSGQAIWATYGLQSALLGGEALVGAWSQYLTSPNRAYQFVMQADGNLVLYNVSSQPIWASNTTGNPGAYLVNQASDGNLVVYSASGQALWNSGTGGYPGDALQVQNDGNAVIYSSGGQAIWETKTQSGGGGGGSARAWGATFSFNPFATLYSGECTYWADHEFGSYTGGKYLNVRGNAYQWANEAQAGGWTVTGTPEVDSVVVFQPWEDGAGKVGHVAWVEQVSGVKIYVSEMNVVGNGIEDHKWYTVTPNLRFILAP